MQKKLGFALWVVLILSGVFECAQTPSLFAQGTAFTYQGQLSKNGAPATGLYDFHFAIYDSTNLPGVLLAGPVTNASVTVSNGLFTTALEFGNVFTGASNWLDISVSASGSNTFSALAPRQQLTPTPYAIFAGAANALTGPVNGNQLIGLVAASNLPPILVTNLPEIAGPLPVTNSFASHGGRLVINAAGSGYTTTVPILGMVVQLDGVIVGTNKIFEQTPVHLPFVFKPFIRTGVAAGTHSIVLTALPGTITDGFDAFNVTVEELPY